MKTFIPGSCTIEQTAVDVFLRHDGKRIAKLGRPKLHAPPNWVSVASGYTVQEYHGHGIGELLVTRDGGGSALKIDKRTGAVTGTRLDLDLDHAEFYVPGHLSPTRHAAGEGDYS